MHILPDLAAIEAKFEGRPFCVVGVHSAKFDNEKDMEAIRSAGALPLLRPPLLVVGLLLRRRSGAWSAAGVGAWRPCGTLACLLTTMHARVRPLAPPTHAVLRYEVTHPVVNDGGMALWRDLGVSSWPTLAVVSPTGRVIAMLAGARAAHGARGRPGLAAPAARPAAAQRHRRPSHTHVPLLRPSTHRNEQARATARTLTTS